MKNVFKFITLCLIVTVAFTNCKKEQAITPPAPPTSQNGIQEGTWKVVLFSDKGNNETNHFSGYTFKFSDGGILGASNNNALTSGTWSSRLDDKQTKLIINFATPPLNELNEDWHLVNQSNTSLELEDLSGGNGGTKYLNFSKI